MSSERKILLMMSGSIACAKATGLISEWVKRGDQVRVAATESVSQFVGCATLEGLSAAPVFDNNFASGSVMDHISLAQWADLVIVCPATANLINKLAAGISDDAVSTLWQAAWGRSKPMLVVPAMNHRMWDYPATRRSVSTLREWGVHVLPTAKGDLACGERGKGRMLEVADILTFIDGLLDFDQRRPAGHVLVTGGGTREPIDSVRYIGNHSTGRTSARLAQALETMGFAVTWLGAHSAQKPDGISHYRYFDSFEDLQTQLQSCLKERRFDAVIHAAAVSDYSVRLEQGSGIKKGGSGASKISSAQAVTLELVPNPKLLDDIRQMALPARPVVMGFKLTAGADRTSAMVAVRRQLESGAVDYVVHNDIEQIERGTHEFRVYQPGPDGQPEKIKRFEGAAALGLGLVPLIRKAISDQEMTV